MERHQYAVVQILSHLGQVWVYASDKPELLTTSMMVFDRERPTFGEKTISITSYCFQFFSRVNIEQRECCVYFLIFRGSFGHFYALTEFSMHFMCIIQIWTTCACSSAYKLVEYQICVFGCMLRSHARNGNEFQTPGHRWLPEKHWDAWFLNSSKSKTCLKFMKLGMLSWRGINILW